MVQCGQVGSMKHKSLDRVDGTVPCHVAPRLTSSSMAVTQQDRSIGDTAAAKMADIPY